MSDMRLLIADMEERVSVMADFKDLDGGDMERVIGEMQEIVAEMWEAVDK